jgi:hypothetical protein
MLIAGGVDGRGLDGKVVGPSIGCRSIFSGILEEICIFIVIVVGQMYSEPRKGGGNVVFVNYNVGKWLRRKEHGPVAV